MQQASIVRDFLRAVFSPRVFFTERFKAIAMSRKVILGWIGTCLGLAIGNALTFMLSRLVEADLAAHPEVYQEAIKSLGLSMATFSEALTLQQGYSLTLGLLSPIVALMAPHLLGGALWAFLYLFTQSKIPLDLPKIIACASTALASLIFYAIPAIGPAIALVMVSLNISRALYAEFELTGFMKTMSIVSAVYICFFLSAATLQLLAAPIATWLKL